MPILMTSLQIPEEIKEAKLLGFGHSRNWFPVLISLQTDTSYPEQAVVMKPQ